MMMMPQLGASPMIIILTTLEVSCLLLELSITLLDNIFSTGVTHDNYHLQLPYFLATGHRSSLLVTLMLLFYFKDCTSSILIMM
jgi:hypothetical protein